MRVRVDEARRERHPLGLNDRSCPLGRNRAGPFDARDGAAFNSEVAGLARRAGAVDDQRVANDEVVDSRARHRSSPYFHDLTGARRFFRGERRRERRRCILRRADRRRLALLSAQSAK